MRIAMVVPGGVDRSGEQRVIPALLALLERLSATHEIEVIALNQEPQAGAWALAGARIHNIGARSMRLRALHTVYRLHRHRRFEVIHAIWSGYCGLIAAAAGKALGIASVVHVAGGELTALPQIGYGAALTLRGRVRETLTLRSACAVTAASAPMIDALSRIGIAARRVPLGVDLDRWPPRRPVPRDARRPVRLVHVASLNRVKDQGTLLRALSSLSESGVRFDMDVVGEDTLAGEMQALAERLGVAQRVRFHGFLTQRALRPLIEAADLSVMSSLHEAGPLVALEAAVAGVPTVGTRVGHLAEWAPLAAVAVPIGDANALAEAIRGLIENEELRLKIAHEAQRRATREDAEYTAAQFSALYAELRR